MKKPMPQEESGEKAPLWIISFADMISLLMAFFVMLTTLAAARSGKLCNQGEAAFDRTIYGFRSSIQGFGVFPGEGYNSPGLNNPKTYYPAGGDVNDNTGRIIDAKGEKMRRLFHNIGKFAKTRKPQIRGRNPGFVVTPIKFERGQAALNESAKLFLTEFCATLQQNPGLKNDVELYVVGLAADQVIQKQQWMLSVKRAEAVATFIETKMAGRRLPVYAWGAGSGGGWVEKGGPASGQTQILIAFLAN